MSDEQRRIRKLLFLGAGFDVRAGIPTMLHFFPTVWNLMGYATGLGGHERDIPAFCEVRRVWETWRRRPETKGELDLEEFALFVDEHCPTLMADFRYVIARTLDLSKERGVGFLQGAPIWRTIYLAFAKQLLQCRNEIAVLSVNYSLILDQALLQVGVEPNYHLPGEIVWLNDDHRPGQTVNLFKPHGSINWLVPVEKGQRADVVVDLHPGPLGEEQAGNWQTSERATHPQDGSCLLKPLIAPPTKEEQPFDSNDLEGQLLRGIKARLGKLLPDIESCFVIGWSAPETDKQDVIQLLRKGLKHCKRLYVLNYSNGHDNLSYTLKKNYEAFAPKKVDFQWDWNSMREPGTIPLWEDFLKI